MTIEHTFTIEYHDARYHALVEALAAYRLAVKRRIAMGQHWAKVDLERIESLIADLTPQLPQATATAPALSKEAKAAVVRIERSRSEAAGIIADTRAPTDGKASGGARRTRRR